MTARDPVAIAAEIEALAARVTDSAASDAAAEAQRLVQLVVSWHGAGLSRIIDLLSDETGGRERLLERLASDPLVASLLALHDLAPRPGGEALIQIVRPSARHASGAEAPREERCELCAAALPEDHGHLVDVETRRLLCACAPCSTVGGKYRQVPSRYLHGRSMTITPAEWDGLGIPVGLVFFIIDSHRGRTVACYPGPAGATESLLPLDAWPVLAARHPWLQQLAPDVEALLVRRTDDAYRCHVVPIDACYELVGRIRKAWSGLGGDHVVEREIDQFFAAIVQKAERQAEVQA